MDFNLNYFSLLASAFAAMVIGFFWYSPRIFGGKWMAAAGITHERLEKGKSRMPYGIIGGFVCQIITGYMLIQFADAFFAVSISDALQVAFFAWLGFFAVPSLHAIFWEHKPVAYWAINAGYQLASFSAMALILVLWH